MSGEEIRVEGAQRLSWSRDAIAAWTIPAFFFLSIGMLTRHPLGIAVFGAVGVGFSVLGIRERRRVLDTPIGPIDALAVREDALVFGGRRVCARHALATGDVCPDTSGAFSLRLMGRTGATFAFRVPSTENGRSILEALGIATAAITATYPMLGSVEVIARLRRIRWLLLAPMALVPIMIAASIFGPKGSGELGFWIFLTLVAIGQVARRLLIGRPGSVTIGADGVVLRSRDRTYFVPIADVRCANVYVHDRARFDDPPYVVRIVRNHGLALDFVVGLGNRDDVRKAWSPTASAIAERINHVVAESAARRAAEEALDAALVRPDARAMPEWVDDLRALANRPDTFRDAATDRVARLWALLEDASAPALRRAAAAIALGGKLDDASRIRISRVAEGTASPRLRVTLEAASRRDDDRLAEELAALEEEEARMAR